MQAPSISSRFLPCATLLSLACCFLSAQPLAAASPALGIILPRGGQRGTSLEVVFHGNRLDDAQEILYYSSAFTTEKLEVIDGKKIKLVIKIAPDCPLGAHAMRVRTATGISELRTFLVGALPPVEEKEPNSDFGAPQRISLNSTVAGVVDNEDVDYYAFEAKKGQRVSAEIEAMRLGGTIFDAYIAILDAARFELAAADDSSLLKQDAACQAMIPEDGTYYVQVRESSYGGNGNCRYRLHVGTFPRPAALYPAGGKLGEEVEVTFIGDARGPMTQKIRVTEDLSGLLAEDADGVAPSANPFRATDLGNTLEVEPNNDHKAATAGAAPGALNGILEAPGDVDVFRFKAEKGQVFEVELLARRLGSPLDSVLRIHHLGGGQIAANDDSRGPDSYLRFKAPETKEYALTVTDHLGKGGPDYVYRVEVAPQRQELSLTIPRVAQNSQERQSIVVPRGNRFATLVSAARLNFGGDLVLAAGELPAGVTLASENMPANLTSIPVLFEAAVDAPIGGAICDLPGRHVDPKVSIAGGFQLGVDLLVGNPGQSVYLSHRVNGLAVAVAEEAPFKLQIVEPKVPLVQSGTMGLRVVAERQEGFKAPIRLEMVFNPPGVSSQGGVTIPADGTEAVIGLNANGNAAERAWKIVVNGSADGGKGPVWAASQLATLRVARPYLTLEVQKGSAEQGKETELACKVHQHTKFEGKAKISLAGLPHKVSSQELEASAETTELVFPVKIASDSPAGRHRNIFCRVELVENGEAIVHSTGGTELRVDKPLPPPKPKKEKPAAVAQNKPKPPPKPKEPPKKQLTRLEKLRLEFEARKDAGEEQQ